MNFHPIENSSDTAEIVVPILINWYHPQSVLDLGCNTGQWLKWFINNNINDVFGVDGENMLDEIQIPEHRFIIADLTKSSPDFPYLGEFDLLLCLEVAEHLQEQFADVLVDTCIKHSDIIFWSAATPGQGGYHHINEQPHEYWIEKFMKRGYKHRILINELPILPHDYYRKNAIEFIKEK